MARARWSGITFGNMYFVDQDDTTEATHFHELCHVVQWQALGVRDFLMTYALGLLEHGYRQSPLEEIAYRLQAEFDAGFTPPDLVDLVTEHARATWRSTIGAAG